MAIIQGEYNIDNGTGYDTVYLKTKAELVETNDGDDVETILNSHSESLAEKVTYFNEMYKNLSFLKAYGGGGSVNILSDSIGEGYGVASEYEYATLFSKKIFELDKTTDYEMIANMSVLPSDIVKGGSYSYGTKGAVKKSLVMQVGATLTITRAVEYLDFFFYKNTGAGKLEIKANGTVFKTIDCSGVEEFDKCSFPTTTSPIATGTVATYTITCIDNPVEITGVLCLNPSVSAIHCNRMAVAGTATGDYIDTPTLTSIAKVGSFSSSSKNLFIIALGTNDIYNPSKAVSASVYKANLRTIAQYLINAGNTVILTVPPHPESNWAEVVEPYKNYKKNAYELADELNLSIIDYSSVDFTGLYIDGLHPNIEGHKLMYETLCKALANPSRIRSSYITASTPYCRLYNTGTITIPNGAFTSIPFNAEKQDDFELHDNVTNNTRITIKNSGFYTIFGNTEFASNVTGARCLVIKQNGTTYLPSQYINAVNGLPTQMTLSVPYYLNAGDYIELQAYQTSGGNLDATGAKTGFGVVKVG